MSKKHKKKSTEGLERLAAPLPEDHVLPPWLTAKQSNLTIPKRKRATSYVPGIPPDFQLTPEFARTFDLMEHTQEHLFITGKAGTGKSTLLHYFKEKTKKKFIVVAPTGIAALNVGGVTIHSFFQLPPRFINRNDVKATLDKGKKAVFESLETVVIDEISMVRADIMDAIDLSLRINRGKPAEPFGGVQMVMIGDLYQLPPVVETALTEHFDSMYGSPYFFNARIFRQVALEKIELQKIFRQTDPVFIGLLNKVRNRQVSPDDLRQINRLYDPDTMFGESNFAITLTSTNALAFGINTAHIEGLDSQDYFFEALIVGEFEEKMFPTEKRLRLRQGAQVMMVKNDLKKNWYNGSIGIIEKIDEYEIWVSINGCSYLIPKVEWEKIEYQWDADEHQIVPVTTGVFQQYPLKLAWAITIHKSQGQTFDKVIIDMGHGAFTHGQAYVALSRCRTFNGIQLRRPIKASDIILDDRVVEFLSIGNEM